MRTAAAKTVIKVRTMYYSELPGGYLPHEDQTRAMAQGAIDQIRQRHALVAGEVVDAFDPRAKHAAIERVLDAGADTIVLASAQPIYSDFEELSGSFVGVHKVVERWRKRNGNKPIKIVIPPYMASQPAFDRLILDSFAAAVPAASSPGQSAMGILTLHGLPIELLGKDSWDGRVKVITQRLVPQAESQALFALVQNPPADFSWQLKRLIARACVAFGVLAFPLALRPLIFPALPFVTELQGIWQPALASLLQRLSHHLQADALDLDVHL
jgi:protoheme ferro-lyase